MCSNLLRTLMLCLAVCWLASSANAQEVKPDPKEVKKEEVKKEEPKKEEPKKDDKPNEVKKDDPKKEEPKKDDPKKDDPKKDDPKKEDKPKEEGKKEERKPEPERLASAGSLTGRISDWDPSSKVLSLDVELKIPELDVNVANQIAAKNNELLRASVQGGQNPADRLRQQVQIQADIARLKGQLYKTKTMQQKYELSVKEDALIRRMDLPVTFDDKGNIQKYTAAQLKELKGDPRLPGYKAGMEDMRSGAIVQVTLGKRTGANAVKVPPPGAPGAKKPGEKVDPNDPAAKTIKLDPNTLGTTIYILTEPKP